MAELEHPPAAGILLGWVVRYSMPVERRGRRRRAYRIVWARLWVEARAIGGDYSAEVRRLPEQRVA